MPFLIRNRGKKVKAHIWLGNDTACRMYSTGGLRQPRYEVHETSCGRPICTMCQINFAKPAGLTPEFIADPLPLEAQLRLVGICEQLKPRD